jgi:hypothetical protein
MTGYMTFYDEPSSWGLIMGDDERLYVVRGRHVLGFAPRVGEKVRFEPEETGQGLKALAVRRLG